MIRFHFNLRSGSPFFPEKRHNRRLFLNSLKVNDVEAQVEFTLKVMERKTVWKFMYFGGPVWYNVEVRK